MVGRSIVGARWASFIVVDDATLVVVPTKEGNIFARAPSADSYRDGAHEVQGSLELGRIIRSHIPVVADTNHIFARMNIAPSIILKLRVVLFSFKAIILNVS